MANNGFIMTDRAILDTWLWEDNPEPFDKRSAFQYLQFQANYKDKSITLRKTKRSFVVRKGSFLTSVENLAQTWHWSKGKVRRFLEDLTSTHMIRVTVYTYGTLVTLVGIGSAGKRGPTDRYDDGHGDGYADGSDDGSADGYADGSTDGTRHNKVNKSNKDNNTRNKKSANARGNPWEVLE